MLMIVILLFNLLNYYFGLCRPFGCAAYSCSNAYVKRKPGWLFFGFRSTRYGKSSACWLGLQQASSLD